MIQQPKCKTLRAMPRRLFYTFRAKPINSGIFPNEGFLMPESDKHYNMKAVT